MLSKSIYLCMEFLAMLLSAIGFRSCTIQPETLKVMSWNIWHAGHVEEYGDKSCADIIGIMKASKADVIMVIETYGASDKIADSLGFYHRLISDNLSVYSRFPIVRTFSFPDRISTFNFGGVEIDMNGRRIRVFDTWLHYLPDARLAPVDKGESEILAWDNAGTRDDEIRVILDILKPYLDESDEIPVIMGGDFNIHSHLDWTDDTKDMYRHGGAVVGWTVSKEMEKAGFRDSFREANPDPAENIGTTWMAEVDSMASPIRNDRIDFIYCHGNKIHTVDSGCYDAVLAKTLCFGGGSFNYYSDHGFVLSEFRMD